MEFVGIPRLCYILEQNWGFHSTNNGVLPDNQSKIVVPHVHPGFERYGAYSNALNQLLDLTWTITLIIGELAIKYAKQTSGQNRGRLIYKIWEACNPESDSLDGRLAHAYSALSDIKDELDVFRENRRQRNPPVIRLSTDDTLHQASILRMDRYSIAQDEPGTDKKLIKLTNFGK